MRKKIGAFLVAGLFCLSFVGCGKEEAKNQTKETVKEIQREEVKTIEKAVEGSGIAGLLEKGERIKCEYKMEQENDSFDVSTYIDGEKFKTQSNMGGMEAVSIFDGETYYNWTTGEMKQGTKIEKRCMQEMEARTMGDKEAEEEMTFDNVEEIIAGENKMQMNCFKTDEIDWNIPTDVKFIDTCKMMEGLESQAQNMEKMQKDMEKMQKDMGL